MLDIQFIRDNGSLLQQIADKKGIDLSIHELLSLDELRRRLLTDTEKLRYERNRLSEAIGQWVNYGEHQQAEQAKLQVKATNEALRDYEVELAEAEREYNRLMLLYRRH